MFTTAIIATNANILFNISFLFAKVHYIFRTGVEF